MRRFVQNQPYMNSSCNAVTKRGKATQGYINRRLTSKRRERVLFQPPVSKIPLLNAVSSSGDHIARIGLKMYEGFRQDSEVILALEKLPDSKRLLWLRLCSFPRGGRDNSAPVCNYL